MNRLVLIWCLAAFLPVGTTAQLSRIEGTVRDSAGAPIQEALVEISVLDIRALTDSSGFYALTRITPGSYDIVVRKLGYIGQVRSIGISAADSVLQVDVQLRGYVLQLEEIATRGRVDRLLDPSVVQTENVITAAELRQLPVTTLDQAIALQPGVSDGSFRGGRLGQDVLVVDGLQVKNQFNASTDEPAFRIPIGAISEATLVTNGFSARHGQALSGVVDVNTRIPGGRFDGAVAYETDRSLPASESVGLDRLSAWMTGPTGIGRLGYLITADLESAVDHSPVAAPRPSDAFDLWEDGNRLLPNNIGQRSDFFGKLHMPLGRRSWAAATGAFSDSRRLLFDRELKYSPDALLGAKRQATLVAFQSKLSNADTAYGGIALNMEVSRFERDAISAPMLSRPGRTFGAFSTGAWEFAGEQLARNIDLEGSLFPISGIEAPGFAVTPYGIPAFFRTASSRGQVQYNNYRETRFGMELFTRFNPTTAILLGGDLSQQEVATYQRVLGYLPTESALLPDSTIRNGPRAPDPAIATFTPRAYSAFVEFTQRVQGLGLNFGVRVDGFDSRRDAEIGRSEPKLSVSPRFAIGDNEGATTFTASIGRFAQAPDYQFLVDAAFDDSVRTGRSRIGNPNTGFESATQFELGVRHRLDDRTSFRLGFFYKRMEGLAASLPLGLDPDSTIFGNADFGTARGVEFTVQRDMVNGLGLRVSYGLQQATASAPDGFSSLRFPFILRFGEQVIDTIIDIAFEEVPFNFDRRHSLTGVFRIRAPEEMAVRSEASFVFRYQSGLPWTRTNLAGDSLRGLPNGERLPFQLSLDALLRVPLSQPDGSIQASLFLDVRNFLNRANVVAVRGNSGTTAPSEDLVRQAASLEFARTVSQIPRESPRYREDFDLNRDGIIALDEVQALYRRAAADFLQPVFQYGPPRTVRTGIEIRF